jgi:uncharacterized membrane-anchored protein YjiN (DUF445 family)
MHDTGGDVTQRPSSVARIGQDPRATRRNPVGTVSLLVAAAGAAGTYWARTQAGLSDVEWLRIVSAGFEAALIGGLADWFAVTALFRHPLGIPIPHTAIIPARRGKIIESIVTMIEDEWLSPEVIGARLRTISPSTLLMDWLEDEEHVQRLGAPIRDFLSSVARTLPEPEVVEFLGRTVREQLAALPVDASTGRMLKSILANGSLEAAFETVAVSAANLLAQPSTAESLQLWLDAAARELRRDGRRMVPMLLRRRIVRRTIVDAGCRYAHAELMFAADHPDHPIRRWVFQSMHEFAERLSAGDPEAMAVVARFRESVADSLEVEPIVHNVLTRLSEQVSADLLDADSALSEMIDRKVRSGILDVLRDPDRRERLDQWVRATADDLLRRNHHQIGVTVRENLEALETGALVRQIEDRVGSDLQFIRLNGAVVGGLIGIAIALAHEWLG